MKAQSAGILLYRKNGGAVEVLLVHPGGPFWAKKDLGSWSVPKGEFAENEAPLAAARREFSEETGSPAPDGDYQALGEAKQSSGKVVHVFALEHDLDLSGFKSNLFEMEWPPKSGTKQSFPECDQAAWVPLAQATQKLVKGQVLFVERLAAALQISLVAASAPPTQASLF
ncbi:MAG TPA: NUDIX domain-containing protein [Candidatus Saccharimonadales bacterium]|nr:NUDIX domain-containing protein [Candidatus Saccharimonadales bacterium]